jgi:hypothetical protein
MTMTDPTAAARLTYDLRTAYRVLECISHTAAAFEHIDDLNAEEHKTYAEAAFGLISYAARNLRHTLYSRMTDIDEGNDTSLQKEEWERLCQAELMWNDRGANK